MRCLQPPVGAGAERSRTPQTLKLSAWMRLMYAFSSASRTVRVPGVRFFAA
jgi:hypothetical protein